MSENTKAKHVFEISYDTSETANHTIDAEKLGEAIVSTAKALKNADKILNGESSDLDLEVKAHSEGSFVVEFVTYINSLGINPLTVLGFAGGVLTVDTVFGAISQIKGRTIKLIKRESNGKTKLVLADNESVELDDDIAELVLNRDIRKNLDTIVKAPLEGTTNAKFITKDESGNVIELVDEVVESFKTPANTVVEKVTVDEVTKDIRFVKVNFEGSAGWQVRLPDNEVITVKMSDVEFLNRIRGNAQNFVKDDLFSVKLKTTTKLRTGNDPLYRTEIIKVIRHRVRPEAKIIQDVE